MRILISATLLAAVAGSAYAADDSLEKGVRKAGDGLGNFLKDVGKGIQNIGKGNEGKKDDKKAAKADPKAKEDKK